MNIFKKLFGVNKKNGPENPYKMSDNPQHLFREIIKRKYWDQINPDAIKILIERSEDYPPKIKNFIYISEHFNLVQDNFLKLSEFTNNPNFLLSLFSLTLCRLGREFHQKAVSKASMGSDKEFEKQWKEWAPFADMAYTSSILCDKFELLSYYGMAFLYSFKTDGKVCLEFCRKYKAMEDKLLNTPNEKLNYLQRASKEILNDPEKEGEIIKEMKEKTDLSLSYFKNNISLKSLREEIEDLENKRRLR